MLRRDAQKIAEGAGVRWTPLRSRSTDRVGDETDASHCDLSSFHYGRRRTIVHRTICAAQGNALISVSLNFVDRHQSVHNTRSDLCFPSSLMRRTLPHYVTWREKYERKRVAKGIRAGWCRSCKSQITTLKKCYNCKRHCRYNLRCSYEKSCSVTCSSSKFLIDQMPVIQCMKCKDEGQRCA